MIAGPAPVMIGLLVERTAGYSADVVTGILRFARAHPHWRLLWGRPTLEALQTVVNTGAEGLIAYVDTRELEQALHRTGRPVFNVSSRLAHTGFASGSVDPRAAASLAGEHLWSHGLRHFLATHTMDHEASIRRAEHFAQYVERRGGHCRTVGVVRHPLGLRNPDTVGGEESVIQILRSMLQLHPVGVFVPMDWLGYVLLNELRVAGIAVPDDCAVVGIDNDAMMCELSWPQLSSVEWSAEELGYRAAACLERMLRGEDAERDIRIAPAHLVVRQSSDRFYVEDVDVRTALQYIVQQTEQGLSVGDVVKQVSVNRRALEQKFQKHLGRTIHAEIRRLRMELARKLLATQDWSIIRVAASCGYASERRFSENFRLATGQTPRTFRRMQKAAQKQGMGLRG